MMENLVCVVHYQKQTSYSCIKELSEVNQKKLIEAKVKRMAVGGDSYHKDQCDTFNALARLAKSMSFPQKKLLFNSFIKSQFNYCPLIWMFCSRTQNRKINSIHERALRIIYKNHTSSLLRVTTSSPRKNCSSK